MHAILIKSKNILGLLLHSRSMKLYREINFKDFNVHIIIHIYIRKLFMTAFFSIVNLFNLYNFSKF